MKQAGLFASKPHKSGTIVLKLPFPPSVVIQRLAIAYLLTNERPVALNVLRKAVFNALKLTESCESIERVTVIITDLWTIGMISIQDVNNFKMIDLISSPKIPKSIEQEFSLLEEEKELMKCF